jgi:hypothetical protein
MSPKQKKIAAKAPPPDKIDAKDFAVLKAEKAKGRGMGLQDEKVKPGKVMKANRGEFIKRREKLFKNFDKTIGVFPKVSSAAGGKGSGTGGRDTRTLTEKGQFIKRRMELAGPKNITPLKVLGKVATSRAGALGAILGAGAVGLNIAGKKLKEFADKKKDKKMGGGMAKKYSKGGDLRAEYIHSQTKKNRKVTGEGYFTERSATRREEYGAAKDRYPNKMDRRKQMLKNLSRVLNPTMGVVKGTIDALNAPTTRKYSVGGGASSKEVYTNARANVDAEGRKNMTMKDLKEARRETYSTKKMVGGMAKKYSNGMTDKTFTDPKTAMIAHSMKTEDKIYKRDREAAKMLEKKAPKGMYSSFMEEKKAIDKVKASKKILGRMGGGMMNKPMGYSSGSKLMDFIKSGSYTDKYGTKTNVDKAIKKINLSPKDKDLATMKPASDKKMMGGGMMQRPMGYKSGTMVKARGCKLGRTRPTKMY